MSVDENSSFRVEQHPQSALFHQPTNSRKHGILSLLAARQENGNLSHRKAKFRNSRVTPTNLSSSIAWNVPRMQNMILAVGPGTPATNTNTTATLRRSNANNDDDDAQDDDGDNDDDISSSSSSSASEPQSPYASGTNESQIRSRHQAQEMSVEEFKDDDDEEEDDKHEENGDDDDNSGAQGHQRSAGGGVEGSSSGPRLSQRAEWFLRAVSNRDAEEHEDYADDDMNTSDGSDDDNDNNDEGDEEESPEAAAPRRRIRETGGNNSSDEEEENTPLEMAQRAILEWMDADDDDNDDENESDDDAVLAEANAIRRTRIRSEHQHHHGQPRNNIKHEAVPSMRHGGCINTAAWLDCPWKLSLCGNSSSDEGYPSPSSIGSNNAYDFGRGLGGGGDSASSSLLEATSSHDCPTQLITSGDDRLIKFWDVRYAMGGSNVFPGGIDTVCPFSAPTVASPEATVKEWKGYQKHCKNPVPGSVLPLLSLPTGHRGNVFHITPVAHHPGKVASCGADGYLRLADLQSTSPASIIVSPEYDADELSGVLPAGLLSLRPGMCFSHHFLNANMGLLCSERGLRKFDLRIGPREQRSQSILGGPYRTCKACAIWSSSSTMDDDVESAYIFAGGSSGDVALYDLRMMDGSESKVVQHYRPQGLGPNASVSVSGLDVSRDKRELLVSYENDQIYSFPIFPNAKSAAGPTVDELAACCQEIDSDEGETSVLRELASYGGHLNRFTFLKNAKYAGPQDEYICTGSDSGHAWIYERATGAVVSLLNADHSTCNGVVPHPTLPLFITYGIDSTAKMWRATTPVDPDVDDSPIGRARCSTMQNYEKSPVVHSWKNVQTTLLSVSDVGESDDEDFSILPDQVPTRDEELERSIFESLGSIFFRRRRNGPYGPGGPYIGNNLQNLPEVLRQNLFACVRAGQTGETEPVRSGLRELKRRMSSIRLHHQAESHGLLWNSSIPWIMRPRDYYIGKSTIYRESTSSSACASLKKDARSDVEYGHPVDLIPDKPSDWIPFDPDMTSHPQPCGMYFNTEDYLNFCEERFGDIHSLWKKKCLEQQGGWKPQPLVKTMDDDGKEAKKGATTSLSTDSLKWNKNHSDTMQTDDMVDDTKRHPRLSTDTSTPATPSSEDGDGATATAKTDTPEDNNTPSSSSSSSSLSKAFHYSWQLLHDTVLLLKESGNAALQEGAIRVAAHRYDKAIQYCAAAFTSYPNGNIAFVKSQQDSLLKHDRHVVTEWVPLLKILINTRLNLAMAMLKPELSDPQGAAEQSSQALQELRPFTVEKGKVRVGRHKRDPEEGIVGTTTPPPPPGTDEPLETFREAKTLQAKAYFRLGTAQYATKDFAAAVKSFEHSIKSTMAATEHGKPGTLVLRRLAEAKREHSKKKRRHRKKFKLMLGEDDEEEVEVENDEEKPKKDKEEDRDSGATSPQAETKPPAAASPGTH